MVTIYSLSGSNIIISLQFKTFSCNIIISKSVQHRQFKLIFMDNFLRHTALREILLPQEASPDSGKAQITAVHM